MNLRWTRTIETSKITRCFVIDQYAIGYVIDSVEAVEFSTYIFSIV
jgi:hypothetical protein